MRLVVAADAGFQMACSISDEKSYGGVLIICCCLSRANITRNPASKAVVKLCIGRLCGFVCGGESDAEKLGPYESWQGPALYLSKAIGCRGSK